MRTLELKSNNNYKPLFLNNSRYILCIGGRASGRSYHASLLALTNLLLPQYFRCAIMRFVAGDIRNSIFQEIKDRITENQLESLIDIKENTLEFSFRANKINGIGFRKSSGDQKSKLKSLASYNCVIIEEADEVAEEDFQQLDDSLRTLKSDIKVIFLLNPPNKDHWIIKRWFNLVDSGIKGFYKLELKSTEKDTTFIFGTYKENVKNINEKTIASLERYKETKPDHYYNMIEGLVSEGRKGLIFPKWKIIKDDDYFDLDIDTYYGLDFGFTNDPTALVEIKEHNDKIYVREFVYETGLTNPMICQKFRQFYIDSRVVYADSQEPKSIEELRMGGFNVKPADKGQGSVNAGIDLLQSKEVYITESSLNLIKEKENYCWKLDKEKLPTNDPIDMYNHGMDAIRYGVTTNKNNKLIGFF